METLEYHTFDKTTWGDGPWMTEPDKMQFPDPTTGLPCLIVRSPLGALCGYVGVPEGHPCYGKDWDDLDVNVHGGLTYSDACQPGDHVPGEKESDNMWWLGFDCAHAWDFAPGVDAELRAAGIRTNDRDTTYRDVAYVKEQIARLAAQLTHN